MKPLAVTAAVLLWAAPRPADACGGYIAHNVGLRINDALELVVVRDGTRTVLSVRNRYRGPVEEFALLVPVPQVLTADDVKTLDESVFDRLAEVTAPQLYFLREDDPCRPPSKGDGAGAPGGARGGGAVQIEAAFQVGEYDVEVLSATDAAGLDTWLRDHDYQLSDDMAPLLRPYVDAGSKFFVAKVDPKRVTFVDGVATLSPLRFAYDADEVSLPLRLSAANSPGSQDVLVHTIARSRLDAANHPRETIPTGIALAPDAFKSFASFYEALFAKVVARQPGVVVTEYARHAAQYQFHDLLPPLGAGAAGDDTEPWIVTRLHLRLDKTRAADDLVLREVEPIRGGRWENTQASVPSDRNDFGAEYEVRAPWTGPAACADPSWGNWEPDGNAASDPVRFGLPPTGGKPALETLVADDVPHLGVSAQYRAPERPARGARRRDRSGGGCCDTGNAPDSTVLLGVVVMLAVRPRRRRTAAQTSGRAT